MTNMFFYRVAGAAFAGLLALGLWPALRAYLKFRGTPLVSCPENQLPGGNTHPRHPLNVLEGQGNGA